MFCIKHHLMNFKNECGHEFDVTLYCIVQFLLIMWSVCCFNIYFKISLFPMYTHSYHSARISLMDLRSREKTFELIIYFEKCWKVSATMSCYQICRAGKQVISYFFLSKSQSICVQLFNPVVLLLSFPLVLNFVFKQAYCRHYSE